MNNVEKVMVTFPMSVGFTVVTFLVNTGRGLQAMMLGEECLISLKSDKLESKTGFKLTKAINAIMLDVAFTASNYTSAERYAKELLDMYHASGDTFEEGRITFKLGEIYQHQKEFKKAKQYYQKAVDMTKCNADKKTEAKCYLAMGNLSYSRSEYHKAKRYYERQSRCPMVTELWKLPFTET